MSYPRLFSPGMIGGLEIRNRIVLPSMTTRLADPDGLVTPELTSYYRERALGGCGLIIVEMASPQARGRHRRRELGIYADQHVDGLLALTSAIHAHGARAGIQLGHGGARALPAELGGRPLAATPGPVPVVEGDAYVNFPEVLDEQSLETLIVDHISAARRAEAAGFDVIELHGAHGYLLTQLSHEDENTVLGTVEGRNRYLADLVRRVVEAVNIPVTYRINGQDYYQGGHTLADTLELVRHVVTSGAKAVSVSGGHYLSDDPEIMIPPMPYEDGVFLGDAGAVRSAVDVPVIAAGRLNAPEVAEEALANGQADFLAIGRGHIADPHWARKVLQGKRVRECIACNYCVREMRSGGTLACSVNPVITTADRPAAATKPQRRLVYGGGPAGLTYALESAHAGHEVCLVARHNTWGAASAPTFNRYLPDRIRMSRYFDALWNECLELGVQIVPEDGVDPVWAADADVVVDARGATYSLPWGWVERVTPLIPGPVSRALSRRLHDVFLHRVRLPRESSGLAAAHQQVVQVGDAAQPGDLAAAVRSAYALAWKEDHHAA